jgi:hypothetical protein
MKKKKIIFTVVFVLVCCFILKSIIAYNTNVQAHKQFWNTVDTKLTDMNSQISETLQMSGDNALLQGIVLTCEDTGAILDYNSSTPIELFGSWHESTGVWGKAANRVYSIAVSYATTKELTEEDILFLKKLQQANEEMLNKIEAKESSLYTNKDYQIKIINEYEELLFPEGE